MATSKSGCLFLDSCVAFSEILEERKEEMNKFRLDVQRRGIPCYLSKSVVVELTRKLRASEAFFSSVFKIFAEGHFKYCRQQSKRNPTDPLDKEDFKIIASIFNELRKSMSSVLQAPLRILEIQVVLSLEDVFRKHLKMDFASFLNGFISQALAISAHLNIQTLKYVTLQQGFFKINNIAPDASISAKLQLPTASSRKGLIHQTDADNISSAWAHRKASGDDTVFVTFDFSTVLLHADEIYKLIGLHCVDPLYAVHYL